MQDKDKRTLDPALMDNAWLQMKQQLDQEMPQKKRRAIWWWTAGLAGLAHSPPLGRPYGHRSGLAVLVARRRATESPRAS